MAANDTSDPEVVAIMERVEAHRRGYDTGLQPLDRSSVEYLYKKDEDFTGYDVAPPVGGLIGWDEYAVGWYNILNKYKEINFKINEDLRVFRRGEVGWSSASYVLSGVSAGGAPFNKECRMSMVWVKEPSGWVITHEHSSAPRLSELASGEKV